MLVVRTPVTSIHFMSPSAIFLVGGGVLFVGTVLPDELGEKKRDKHQLDTAVLWLMHGVVCASYC